MNGNDSLSHNVSAYLVSQMNFYVDIDFDLCVWYADAVKFLLTMGKSNEK